MIRQYTEKLEALFGERDVYLWTCLKMVLVLLLLFAIEIPAYGVVVPLLAVPGILVQRIAFNAYYWVLIALVFTLFYFFLGTAHFVPNYKLGFVSLITSVTIVLFAKRNDEDWPRLFRKLVRWVIGIGFLIIATGRLLSAEYLDGSYHEFHFLTDRSLHRATSALTGLGTPELYGVSQSFTQLLSSTDPSRQISVLTNPMLRPTALLWAYFTVFLQAMIAITFLAPRGSWLNRRREWFLIAFIVGTFPLDTAPGFATMVACAAFIQSFRKGKPTLFSLFYLLLFMAVPLFRLPFLQILDPIFQ